MDRVAELMTLNELAIATGSTLDRDELIDQALEAVTRHLRFDRALILLADEARGVLGHGRSIGGSPEMTAQVAEIELPLDLDASQLVQLYRADGPLIFRDVDQDPDERNRRFAALLEVTSFLGTPLVTKGRSVGILAVDNRLSGRDVRPGDGPLLFTAGSLIAGRLSGDKVELGLAPIGSIGMGVFAVALAQSGRSFTLAAINLTIVGKSNVMTPSLPA